MKPDQNRVWGSLNRAELRRLERRSPTRMARKFAALVIDAAHIQDRPDVLDRLYRMIRR